MKKIFESENKSFHQITKNTSSYSFGEKQNFFYFIVKRKKASFISSHSEQPRSNAGGSGSLNA
jgi:hypothetical protein